MRRIVLDFRAGRRMNFLRLLRQYGERVLLLLLVLQLLALGYVLYKKSRVSAQCRKLAAEAGQLSLREKKLKEKLENLRVELLPFLKKLNQAVERKNFSFTEAMRMLEEALPPGCFIQQINASSNGKFLISGVFSSTELLRSFMQKLSAGGRRVFLTKEVKKGATTRASIVWDMGGEE